MHHRYIFWVYQDSRSPAVGPKGNSKFEILLLQIFSLKPKKKQVKYFQPLQKTILGSFILGFTMRKCKAKAVQADFQVRNYPAYSGIFRTLCSPNIFRTLVYLDPWHIQNQKHIQNRGAFRTLAYSESWCIQNPGIFRAPSNSYHASFCQNS